ncbi:MAG TPA: extracellular solute-binding protein [Desulfotignum sp.]|nr:extracellular solute-binding protein [Desulfotignum sp.]
MLCHNLLRILVLFVVIVLTCPGCGDSQTAKPGAEKKRTLDEKTVHAPFPAERTYDVLPENIQWLTNTTDPVFASPKAEKGGLFRAALSSFPMTFRVVGPDSNGSFRSAILDNQLSLINIHPNTQNIIPELATHWAFDPDKKTMYFKLDPDARWSDGRPVTGWDFAYTLRFMRSEHIIAPWYNDYYSREIEKVMVYDDHTIGVKSTKAVPDLHLKLGISPVPAHFFHPLAADFTARYNWAVVPNTGAYQISAFKKGRYIRFARKHNWWAKDRQYFKNRFNVDTVQYSVIRDSNLQWEYFKKGELETFGLVQPKYWYDKSRTRVVENGYVHRIWFFNDLPRPSLGMWLNQDKEVFSEKYMRAAFAHAMNIEKVIEKVLRGDYFRLAQPFFGYGEYTDYTISPRQYDIKKVESLMTNQGWNRGDDGIWEKEGRRFSVAVTYGYADHMPRLAVLKEEARRAGIELNLEKLDPSAMFKKFLEKQHDVAWMGWSTSMRPSFWQGWHSDNAHKPQTNNITNTDDPKLDALIDRYRESLDEKKRIRLSHTIQNKIHDICAYVPTFMVPYVRIAYWRWLRLPDRHGTRMSQDLFDPFSASVGGLFWLDQDLFDQTVSAMKQDITLPPETIKNTQFKVVGDMQ